MGILDGLFGGSKGPTPRKISSSVSILQTRHGEPIRRYQAAERLAQWGTPEAVDGLLLRYTVTAEKETSDEEEKAHVAELLEKLGAEKVVPAISRYLPRHAHVNWPLRILGRLVSPDEFRGVVTEVLGQLDIHFDRHPERKVELIHALEDHAADPTVGETVAAFLDDTDDTVRIAAARLLASGGSQQAIDRLVDTLVESRDRPRVIDAICAALAEAGAAVKGRKAEVEPMLPEGYYLTRQGGVKRLGA